MTPEEELQALDQKESIMLEQAKASLTGEALLDEEDRIHEQIRREYYELLRSNHALAKVALHQLDEKEKDDIVARYEENPDTPLHTIHFDVRKATHARFSAAFAANNNLPLP